MGIAETFGRVSPEEWRGLLKRSVREPFIGGVEFPRFPAASVQMGFNGLIDEAAMESAWAFWSYADQWARGVGKPLSDQTPVLDIGCGWGRVTRTFAQSVPAHLIHGCDIDAEAIVACRFLGVPGTFTKSEPGKPLPYADSSFHVVTAFSVFTHLPETVAKGLLAEIGRVLAPGGLCVFTVEDEKFFSYFDIPGIEQSEGRWGPLSRHKPRLPEIRRHFDRGGYVYLVTNEESVRSSDVYGDAVVPRGWIEASLPPEMSVGDFYASSPPVNQAVVVVRKS